MISLAIALAALIVCTSSGVDRQVTLHLSGVAYVIVGLAVAVVAGIATRGYLGESSAQTGWLALSNLRRDAPVRWLARGVLLVGFAAALSTAATWYFLTVLVPYLPGDPDRSVGVIERMYTVEARGRLCNIYGVVVLESGSREEFCYERGLFTQRRISIEPLMVGDRVVVVVTHNAVGSAIQSVTPVPP